MAESNVKPKPSDGSELTEFDELNDEQKLEAEEAHQQKEEMLQIFGGGLQTKFNKQVSLKKEIEKRWLDDLRHYNGVYDLETAAKLQDNKKGSKIFVNLTRSKCNNAESKWSDLVLPTDDKNWGIKPTPVPTLVKALKDETPLQLVDGTTPVDPDTQEPHKTKDLAEAAIKEAEEKAKSMEKEMHDQLTECDYNANNREIIHNAVVIGTGIIKGPMVQRSAKKAWVKNAQGQYELSQKEEFKPTAVSVDPWNFFPDMIATSWKDSEFCFERHMMTKKRVRALAKQPGFMSEQIKRVLEQEPNARHADISYLNELREINGITNVQEDNRYEVLEYHGPIDKQDLIACGVECDMDDELEAYEGVVWLCLGIVIRAGLNHMDTDELPYDVLCWEKDDVGIFGYGVPYRMRSPQKVMNASWRMVLDNAGLSTGPQIVINKAYVTPVDGIWELSPRKVWWMNIKDPKVRADFAFSTFAIDNNQQELTNIFEMAHRLADEETSVPQMNMGSQPSDAQQPAMLKTLGGTALWMSAQNIMMRKAIKNFDDDLTVPFLTRLYDWNMQFNPKEDIKGDYSIDARGTSVLLVREMQARNIQEFVGAAINMPEGAVELDVRGVLKNMAKGMQISVDDVMRTDDEYETWVEEMKTNPPPDPEMMKLEMQKEISTDNNITKVTMARENAQLALTLAEAERQNKMIERDTAMTQMAATGQIAMDKNAKDFQLDSFKTKWDIRAFYEEMKIKKEESLTANYGLESDS